MFNAVPFNATPFNGSTFEIARSFVADKHTVLQVRNSSGTLLHRLDGWFNAPFVEKINVPTRLSFSIPLDHPAVQAGDVVGPNEIWIFDGSHQVKHKLIIQEETVKTSQGKALLAIKAEGYLSQLRDEKADVTLNTETTAGGVITAVLNAQSSDNPIVKGYIEPSISATAIDIGDATGQTLLSILNRMRTANVGGWFQVDSERRLSWYSLTTARAKHVFQLADNLEGYSETTRRKDVFNRIFAKGGVVGTAPNKLQLSLNSPGYLEDSGSQTTYGRRPHTLRVPWVRTQAQLQSVARKFLDDHLSPPIRRTMPAIDQSMLLQDPDNTTPLLEQIAKLGKAVKIKPPANHPSSTTIFSINIVGLTRKLDEALPVKVTFGEEDVDIYKILAETINERQDDSEITQQDIEDLWQHIDTGIGINFPELGDTPGSLVGAGTLYQTNTAIDALVALLIGTVGQMLTPNAAGTALEWVDFFRKGANKSALGTPAVPCFGLITTAGDNRLMFWDQEAADQGTPDSEDWRDVNSYGKTAT